MTLQRGYLSTIWGQLPLGQAKPGCLQPSDVGPEMEPWEGQWGRDQCEAVCGLCSMTSRGACPTEVLLHLPTGPPLHVRSLFLPSICLDPLAIGTLDTCSKARGYNLERKEEARDKTHVGCDPLATVPPPQ